MGTPTRLPLVAALLALLVGGGALLATTWWSRPASSVVIVEDQAGLARAVATASATPAPRQVVGGGGHAEPDTERRDDVGHGRGDTDSGSCKSRNTGRAWVEASDIGARDPAAEPPSPGL